MPRLRATLFVLFALPCLLVRPALATRYSSQPLGGGRPAKTTKQRNPTARPAPVSPPVVKPSSPPPAAVVPAAVESPALVHLTGLVLTPEGRPCPGVCVFPSNAPLQIVVTNAKGEFEIPVPAHAAISLQAELMGKGRGRVTLAGVSAQPVRIVLER